MQSNKEMKRQFPYWTWGKIINILTEDGLKTNRENLRRFERKQIFPEWHRTIGGWRVARNQDEALLTMKAVWAEKFGKEEAEKYYVQLKNRFSNSTDK
jgi:hypothetical protein